MYLLLLGFFIIILVSFFLLYDKDSELKSINEIYTSTEIELVNKINELEKNNTEYQKYLSILPFGLPLDSIVIISRFGYRRDPFDSTIKFHSGLDLYTRFNDSIYATGSGKVIFSGRKGGYGRCVIIEHAIGYKSLYAHLNKKPKNIKRNVIVKQGDLIGFAGRSGRAKGVHLHYEIIRDGKKIDPYNIIVNKQLEL